MAEDILCLLDYLQWTEGRSLHIVGISLGGMIAQGTLSVSLEGTSETLPRTRIPHPGSNYITQSHRHTRRWQVLGQYTPGVCAYRLPFDMKNDNCVPAVWMPALCEVTWPLPPYIALI